MYVWHIYMCEYTRHGLHLDDFFFHHVSPRCQTQVVRLGADIFTCFTHVSPHPLVSFLLVRFTLFRQHEELTRMGLVVHTP